ncbi:MAG: DUF1549 and DUF1553 domain-containing protein [Planctomycetota bacterium]
MRRPAAPLSFTSLAIVGLVLPSYGLAQSSAEHWAWQAVRRPATASSGHPIDHFVAAEATRLGLALGSIADRAVLVRRLWLQLCGLPAPLVSIARAEAGAEETWFDAALAEAMQSPAFAERWAAWWLDLARYADTRGYEKDDRRSIWPYRDWVIRAFDEDMPFDRFTIAQLAGDLLDAPTDADIIATGFHRNTMTNDEGGTDDEEFRVAAVVDRVNTTFDVWFATTMSCAQCHDHKYDPISQREYYRLFAFFDQSMDSDRGDEAPTITVPTPTERQQIEVLDARIAALRQELDAPVSSAERSAWEARTRGQIEAFRRMAVRFSTWEYAGGKPAADFDSAWNQSRLPEISSASAPTWETRSDWVDGTVHTDLVGAATSHLLRRRVETAAAGTLVLSLGSDDAIRVQCNDRVVFERKVTRAAQPDQERVFVELPAGTSWLYLEIVNGGGPAGFYFRSLDHGVDPRIASALASHPTERSTEAEASLVKACRETSPRARVTKQSLDSLLEERARIRPATTLVMRELPAERRRRTRIHERGNFLRPGDTVEPGTPAFLHEFDPSLPRNRLGLAKWIVSPANPLVARVFVNRIWEQLFGSGLVVTTEEFGTQGEPPSHPDLLDWLAAEFRDGGYRLRHLLAVIVTSQAWKRSSTVDPSALEIDRWNRWFARGPAFRLPAEAIRDSALSVAGLLSTKRFGPSVMPHQPDGVWSIVYSGDRWQTSPGEDAHRRSLYTFWRRTSPYPSMTSFDAPSREFCVVKRSRTNTPLQALVTLNDPVFVECARVLGQRMANHDGSSRRDRLEFGFRLCLSRRPTAGEIDRLEHLFDHPSVDDAWFAAASVLLNLDEFLVVR